MTVETIVTPVRTSEPAKRIVAFGRVLAVVAPIVAFVCIFIAIYFFFFIAVFGAIAANGGR